MKATTLLGIISIVVVLGAVNQVINVMSAMAITCRPGMMPAPVPGNDREWECIPEPQTSDNN